MRVVDYHLSVTAGGLADEATDDELIFQKLSVPRQSTAESLLDSSHPAIRHPLSLSKVTLNSTTVGIPTTRRHRERQSAPKPDPIRLRGQHEHEEPVSEVIHFIWISTLYRYCILGIQLI